MMQSVETGETGERHAAFTKAEPFTDVVKFRLSAADDVDGDSISYKLTICKTEDGQEIKGYSIPTASNSFSMDPISELS